LYIVKAKEKNKQRINIINQEIKELEQKLKTCEVDRSKVVNLKKELDSRSEERLQLQKNIYDSNGNLIEDEMIAMEGDELQRLTGGYKEKKEKLHFKSSEQEQSNEKSKEFVLNNEKSFRKVVKNLRVIARASPEDKYLLVLGLKQIGNVVAVTGDGTNS
jgi:magnesium-transporting ATPase (P-type)